MTVPTGLSGLPFLTAPNCLYCNWDDDQGGDASVLAACVGRTHSDERRDLYWVEKRNYIAFLCAECADSQELVRWFWETVRHKHLHALFIRKPGTQDEARVEPYLAYDY